MKKLILAVAVITVAMTGVAVAQDGPTHKNGGLGFHNIEAPLGVRWWFPGQKAALDLGIGFVNDNSFSFEDPDDNVNYFAIDVGIPYRFASWDRVHVLGRIGLLYESQEYQVPAVPTGFDTETATQYSVPIEIEAEVFLVDNLSISASHGIAFVNTDPGGGGESTSSFGTFGNNFTNIGFHVYIFGGEK